MHAVPSGLGVRSLYPDRLDLPVQLAKQQLETALRSVERESMMITDSEVADVHYKLGRICWTMGGVQLTDPNQARSHLEAATKHESEVQVMPPQYCIGKRKCFMTVSESAFQVTPLHYATRLCLSIFCTVPVHDSGKFETTECQSLV